VSQSNASAHPRGKVTELPRKTEDPRITLRRKVMLNKAIPPAARVLFFFLDDLYDPARGACWWRWQKIALLTGNTKPTFFRLIQELVDAGAVRLVTEGRRTSYVPVSREFSVSKMRPFSIKNETEADPDLITYPESIIQSPQSPPEGGGEKPKRCAWCRGRGHRPGCFPGTCPGCDGTGEKKPAYGGGM